ELLLAERAARHLRAGLGGEGAARRDRLAERAGGRAHGRGGEPDAHGRRGQGRAGRQAVRPGPAPAAGALAGPALGLSGPPADREQRELAYRANNRGVALLEQFRAPDAAEAFRQALARDEGLTLARTNLAIALVNVPDLPGAEQQARLALQAQPESP